MKKITAITALCILSSCSRFEEKKYEVELSYCDGRKDTVTVLNNIRPSNQASIHTYKRAVPVALFLSEDYINVCNVKVLTTYE